MIREVILRDFSNWSAEKQLAEFQAYKKLGSFSPFTDADYALMEMVINNPNAEVSVQCEDGVCGIVNESHFFSELNITLNESVDSFKQVLVDLMNEPGVTRYYKSKGNKEHLLKLFKKALSHIDNPKFLEKIKHYLNQLPSKSNITNGVMIKWEKDIYKSDRATMELYAKNKFIDFGRSPTDTDDKNDHGDPLVLNYNVITPEDIGSKQGLSALLVLDLLHGLNLEKTKTYIHNLRTSLADIGTQSTTDEQPPTDKKLKKQKASAEIATILNNMTNMHDLVTVGSSIKGNSETLDLNNQTFDSYLAANRIVFQDVDENGMNFETRMTNRIKVKYGIKDASENLSTVTAKRISILEQINAKGITAVDWETVRTLPGFPDEGLLKKPNPIDIAKLLNQAFTAMKNAGTPYAEAAEKLVTFGDAGEGRGEKFVEFVFPFANSGGQESFDIQIGPQKYEVKTYKADANNKTIAESIRLGQEGSIFKVDKFTRLFMFLTDLSKIFTEGPESNNYAAVKEMLNDAITEESYNEIAKLLHATTSSGNTIIDQIKKGEFSYTNIEKTSTILDILNIGFKSIKENNFYYLKIYLNDENYNLSVEPVKPSKVSELVGVDDGSEITFAVKSRITKASEQDVKNSILRILANSDIFTTKNYLHTMIEDGMTRINDEFKLHPMIIISDHLRGGDKNIAVVGVFNRFKFNDITQSGFKVVPEDYTVAKSSNN